jgi:hypothetical protein
MTEVYRQAPGIPARNVEGVMAVITPRTSEIHRLNPTATVIWNRCQEGATRDQLVEALSHAFQASEGQLRQDVDLFLTQALQKGILITQP